MEINSRPRGRHLARRPRASAADASALTWEPSEVVRAHTGSIPVIQEDPGARLQRLEAIRDHLSADQS